MTTITARPAVKVNPAEIVRLYTQEGLGVATLAERMWVSKKTIQRWLRRALGADWSRQAVPPVTEAQRARIVLLAREGVPDGWIAEDVSLAQRTVGDIRKGAGISVDSLWKSIRLQIQHDAELFANHLEFAPESLRRSDVPQMVGSAAEGRYMKHAATG